MAATAGSRKTDETSRAGVGAARVGDFDDWADSYGDFYPDGTRLDREYRLSRLMVMAGRSWMTHIDNRLRAETGVKVEVFRADLTEPLIDLVDLLVDCGASFHQISLPCAQIAGDLDHLVQRGGVGGDRRLQRRHQ